MKACISSRVTVPSWSASAEGRLAICPEISEALAVDRVQEERTGLQGLSPREFEIFRMILDAKINR
jgi:hypothetical protein